MECDIESRLIQLDEDYPYHYEVRKRKDDFILTKATFIEKNNNENNSNVKPNPNISYNNRLLANKKTEK